MSGLDALGGPSWNQIQSSASLSSSENLSKNAFGRGNGPSKGEAAGATTSASQPRSRHEEPRNAREAFQDFVAGTFYKEMLKSLRNSVDKSAYFHGGQAEEVFQSQMDQQVAEDLARTDGAQFADTLYQAMMKRDVSVPLPVSGAQVAQAYAGE